MFVLQVLQFHSKVSAIVIFVVCLTPLSTILSYIVAASFIGGGNRPAAIHRQSLSSTPRYKRDSYSRKSNHHAITTTPVPLLLFIFPTISYGQMYYSTYTSVSRRLNILCINFKIRARCSSQQCCSPSYM
jgi:hypothetical protein